MFGQLVKLLVYPSQKRKYGKLVVSPTYLPYALNSKTLLLDTIPAGTI